MTDPTLVGAHVVAILRRVAASRPRQVGDYGWLHHDCIRCVAIVNGSHREEVVGHYDPETRTSRCPECGDVVSWATPPGPTSDPRCDGCRECPATTPTGCAPPASGARYVAGGASYPTE